MNLLVIDIGGTHVKVLAAGQDVKREFMALPPLDEDASKTDKNSYDKARNKWRNHKL